MEKKRTMKTYDGETLHNVRVSYKIDGVQGIFDGKKWVDKEGKPLYNLPVTYLGFGPVFVGDDIKSMMMPLDIEPGRYEIFINDRKDSLEWVREEHHNVGVNPALQYEHLYRLGDELDERLYISDCAYSKEVRKEDIPWLLKDAVGDGYEGLVLTADEGEFKVEGDKEK